ncbi:MAG: hypothetical protein ACO2ZM_06280 [Francisellaceae bacterium]
MNKFAIISFTIAVAILMSFILFYSQAGGSVVAMIHRLMHFFTLGFIGFALFISGLFVLGGVVVVIAAIWDEFRK